jgi:hypothetical protein
LTPRHPVPARLLADILEESVGFYGVKLEGLGKPVSVVTEYQQLFCDLISVYKSYWKDDPTFDSTNTRTAAPHLPCPHIDRKLLLKLAEYAIRVNFTSPRAKAIEPKFDLSAALEPWLDATPATADAIEQGTRLGLRVTGHGGGDWTLIIADDEVVGADMGLHARCAAVAECDIDLFAALATGQTTVDQAFADEHLTINGAISGDAPLRPQFDTVFRLLAESSHSRAVVSN